MAECRQNAQEMNRYFDKMTKMMKIFQKVLLLYALISIM